MDLRNLSLSAACVKAVHNSYSRSKLPLSRQLEWHPDRPYRGGCCGIELDLVQKEDSWKWCVQHGGKYSKSKTRQLAWHLMEIDSWSRRNDRDHPPVFLHFDLKRSAGSDADFPTEFDQYIRNAMSDATFLTPGHFLSEAHTLLEGARNGWPTLAESWGHFICCITGNEHDRAWTYLRSDIGNRLCFVDRNANDIIESGKLHAEAHPDRIIYNFRYDRLQRTKSLRTLKHRKALLFRAYEVNDHISWQRAKRTGVNLLATDQVFFTSWALVSKKEPFAPLP